MNRRDLMTSLPVVAASVALPAGAVTPDAEDPILPHYREWQTALAEWRALAELPGNEDWDWPESKVAWARGDAALDAMIAMGAASTDGIAALAHALWIYGGPSVRPDDPDYAEQCESLDHRLMAAIWRAASGQGGVPPR